MGTVRFVPYDQVAPGDVAFDRARSAYGRLVERATGEDIAHAFVYHRRLGTTADGRPRWLIGEMSARHGAVLTERVERPEAVVRVWRVAAEQHRLLASSREVVRASTAYDWPEIARILVALKAGRDPGRRATDRSICVAHVLRAVLDARPDLAPHLPALGHVVTPGRLLETLMARQPRPEPSATTIVASLAAVPGVLQRAESAA